MEITAEQLVRIEALLPRQRGKGSQDNLTVINAILYIAQNGCKWRELPKRFGNWHTIYTRVNRWAKSGVLDRVFEKLQHEGLIRIKIESVGVGAVAKLPERTGAPTKANYRPSTRVESAGAQKFVWLPRVLRANPP